MAELSQADVDTQPPAAQKPRLVVLSGKDRGRVVRLKPGVSVLGRGRRARIQLSGKGLSRNHARLSVRGGEVVLEDLGSTNGCWRNGQRVARAVLEDGDRIRLGACALEFKNDAPTPVRAVLGAFQRATRDKVTGLFCRDWLAEQLEREVERHRRYRRGLALVVFHLDRLGNLTRELGSGGLERLLAEVGKLLRSGFRCTDLAGRMGRGRFLVVMPETSGPQAKRVAEKLRDRIEKLRVEHRGRLLAVTSSVGVTATRSRRAAAGALLARAGEACQRAIRSGRNRVAVV